MRCESSQLNSHSGAPHVICNDGYKMTCTAITSSVLSSCSTWVGGISSLCVDKPAEGCTCRDSMSILGYREHVCFTHTSTETGRDNEKQQEEIKMTAFYLTLKMTGELIRKRWSYLLLCTCTHPPIHSNRRGLSSNCMYRRNWLLDRHRGNLPLSTTILGVEQVISLKAMYVALKTKTYKVKV